MHRLVYWRFNRGDAVLDRLLHLLESTRSIWRTRSRDTPNSPASSASVIGSSAMRRPSKMRRSRSLSTPSASDSTLRRFSNSSLAASVVSWSGDSSGLLEVSRIEPLREPPIDRSEQFAGLLRLALRAPETREAHCGAEFPGFCLLFASNGQGALGVLLGFSRIPAFASACRAAMPGREAR